jgi:predicted nucleotidyltransferase
MAFDERENVTLAGDTLKGERVSRTIPVCGPAAFVVLKALAFADRGEPKDAYDLLYILRR